MGWSDIVCLNNKKAFHVKIILLDKQELIQEVQVRRGVATALGREGGGGDSVDYGEGGGGWWWGNFDHHHHHLHLHKI